MSLLLFAYIHGHSLFQKAREQVAHSCGNFRLSFLFGAVTRTTLRAGRTVSLTLSGGMVIPLGPGVCSS